MASVLRELKCVGLIWRTLPKVCRRQQQRTAVTVQLAAIYNLYRPVTASGNFNRDADDARSVATKKLEVNKVQFNYEMTGTGRNTLLLLPGGLGSSETDYSMQLMHMNKDLFTVIGWDPRGYGRSIPPERDWPENFLERDADDAAAFMKTLGVEKYSVLGWSDGGISALIMAAKYPQNVRKLVVWGANAYVTDEEIQGYESIRNTDAWNPRVREHYLSVYDAGYFRRLCSNWVDAYNVLKAKRGGDICRDALERIQCPTLVIHGEKDQMVPNFHPEFLVQKIKNAGMLKFAEGRHNLHQTLYKQFNSTVEHFLIQPDSHQFPRSSL
jgi:valacyclovir hydrolase